MSTPIASFAARVKRARQNGYSDQEILNHLRAASSTWAEKVQAAGAAGDSPARILGRLLAAAEPAQDLDQVLAVLGEDNGRAEIAGFVHTLGAHVDGVVLRGTSDPNMPAGVSWKEWERRRNQRIFHEGQLASDRERAAKEREETRRRQEEIERQRETRQRQSERALKEKKPPKLEGFEDV